MNYDIANLFVNSLVAIGTMTASVVSLWLAYNSRKEKMKIKVSIDKENHRRHECINIAIVNKGIIDFRIDSIYYYFNNIKYALNESDLSIYHAPNEVDYFVWTEYCIL